MVRGQRGATGQPLELPDPPFAAADRQAGVRGTVPFSQSRVNVKTSEPVLLRRTVTGGGTELELDLSPALSEAPARSASDQLKYSCFHLQSPHLEPLKEDTLAGTYKSVSLTLTGFRRQLQHPVTWSITVY